ncbi:MAG TPA: rhomboid family intramembrane serine protease [Candidatus Acidoferrum sp.]|nr:rhomboid family intramembrane serine protease [Candidatus Acidoferrum sp.]
MLFPPGSVWITPGVTILIIGCWIVAIGSSFGKEMDWVQALVPTRFGFVEGRVGWNSGFPEIRQGEIWRLFTSFFLHFSIPHLLANTFALWAFGTQFEWKHGMGRLFIFAILMQVVVGMFLCAFYGPDSGGASAVLTALFGYLFWRARMQRNPEFRVVWSVAAMIALNLAFDIVGLKSQMAFAAHAGGLVLGMVVAWVVSPSIATDARG